MKKTLYSCVFLCLNAYCCFSQASFCVGVKGSLARIIDTGGPNQVGNFLVTTNDIRNKPMAQAYMRLRWKALFLQPEFRYSTFRFYTRYENLEPENPKWAYYDNILSQNIAGDQRRIDVPLKLGYFITPGFALSAGLMSTFFAYTQRPFIFRDGRRFLIADNVFDSQKSRYLSGTVGVHVQRGRLTIGLDYDWPFKTIHEPVLFNREAYTFTRKLNTYSFSVGFDLFQLKAN